MLLGPAYDRKIAEEEKRLANSVCGALRSFDVAGGSGEGNGDLGVLGESGMYYVMIEYIFIYFYVIF